MFKVGQNVSVIDLYTYWRLVDNLSTRNKLIKKGINTQLNKQVFVLIIFIIYLLLEVFETYLNIEIRNTPPSKYTYV